MLQRLWFVAMLLVVLTVAGVSAFEPATKKQLHKTIEPEAAGALGSRLPRPHTTRGALA